MSFAIYPVRVYYEPNRRGCVSAPGIAQYILSPPNIPGLPKIEAIDYAGVVFAPTIQPVKEARREMETHEIEAVKAWLKAGAPL